MALTSFAWALLASSAANADAAWPTPMPAPLFSIASEGGKGDNATSNTVGFKAAVAKIQAAGGGTLLVPEGTWLTGPFNLTSNMTCSWREAARSRGARI